MLRCLYLLLLISASALGSTKDDCFDIYRDGEWNTAKSICEQAAKAGSPEGMYFLAYVYGRKNTIEDNEISRIYWLEKSAEAGYYKAQSLLAMHYSFEKFDRERAEYFYLMSAINEDANAITFNSFGRFYRIRNKDIEDNEVLLQERWAESYKWHKQAADLGDTYGQIKVGDLYKDGMGVKQNWNAAIEWYKKAASQGDKHAFFRLGYLYLYGVKTKEEVILEQDVPKAYGYLKYAAEKWGNYSHVDLGHFDAYVSNPFNKLPWKETYGKSHHNPKKDMKAFSSRLKKRERIW